MTFTATPGNTNASPQQFVPAYGVGIQRYSKTFTVSFTLRGGLSSIQSNVFNSTSTVAFRALSRVKKFITMARPSL